MNYRGTYLWNTIALSQNTDLQQSTSLKFFKEKLKAYLFILDDVMTNLLLVKLVEFKCQFVIIFMPLG